MILVIRGHIRGSFATPELLNFVGKIHSTEPNLKIFIHTWNVFANNISWREVNHDNTDKTVTKQVIYNYFDGLKHLVEHIIIDDDKKIQLIGNLKGNITDVSPMPIIGWKNYWYSKHKIIDYLYNKKTADNEMIVNFRFDLFQAYKEHQHKHQHIITEEFLINFIKNNIGVNFTKNQFMFDYEEIGIDSIYIGNINTMHQLTHKFFYELDDIARQYNDVIHQEKLVYLIDRDLRVNRVLLYLFKKPLRFVVKVLKRVAWLIQRISAK